MTKEMKEILDEIASIESRKAEFRSKVETADADALVQMNSDLDEMEERMAQLNERKLTIEREEAEARAVAEGTAEVTEVTTRKKVNEMATLKEVRSSEAYINAYAEYIKTGKDEEVRSLLTNLVEGGTIPVPTMVQDAIEHAWANTTILNRIQHVSVPGVLEVPYEVSATGAVEHVEGSAAVAEEVLEIGTIEIKPTMLKKWISYTDEVEAMKGEAFLNYLNAEIAQRIYEAGDKKAVEAMLNTTLKKAITHAFDATTVFAGMAELSDEAKNPVAIMSRATYFNDFMSLTDTTGRPIYNVVVENGKPTYYINGTEVIFSGETGGKVILVDLDALKANTPEGNNIKFMKDPYTLMTEDKVRLLGRMLMGVAVVKPGRTVVITKG